MIETWEHMNVTSWGKLLPTVAGRALQHAPAQGVMRRTIKASYMIRMLSSAVAALIFTSSCTVQNIGQKTELSEDEGILITRVYCAPNINWFEFYETGTALSNANHMFVSKAGSSGCSKNSSDLKTIRLKAGGYFIGVVGGGRGSGVLSEGRSVSFQVEAGKANYIGDIRINTSKPVDTGFNASTVYFSFSVEDSEQQTIDALNADYPWLLAKYELVTRIAKNKSAGAGAGMTRSKDIL